MKSRTEGHFETIDADVLRRRKERYAMVLDAASKKKLTAFGDLLAKSQAIKIFELNDIMDRLFCAYPDNAIFFFDDLGRVADYSASLPLLFEAFSRSTDFLVRSMLVSVCTVLIQREKDGKLKLAARADLIDRLSTMVSLLSIDTAGLTRSLVEMCQDNLGSTIFFFVKALHAPEKRMFLPRLLQSTTLTVPAKLLALQPIAGRHRAEGIALIRAAFDGYNTSPKTGPDRVARTEILTALRIAARARFTELVPDVQQYLSDPNQQIVSLAQRVSALGKASDAT